MIHNKSDVSTSSAKASVAVLILNPSLVFPNHYQKTSQFCNLCTMLKHLVHSLAPLTLYGYVTGFFTGKLQDLSESSNFPIKNPVTGVGGLVCILHRYYSHRPSDVSALQQLNSLLSILKQMYLEFIICEQRFALPQATWKYTQETLPRLVVATEYCQTENSNYFVIDYYDTFLLLAD